MKISYLRQWNSILWALKSCHTSGLARKSEIETIFSGDEAKRLFFPLQVLKPVSALIVVDVQNDFISGSLALKNCPAGEDGMEVVPVIQDLLSKNLFSIVAYTYDWHPSDHCSFADNVSLYPLHSTSQVTAEKAKLLDIVVYDKIPIIDQVLWPRHCEMNTWGAELHKGLTVSNSRTGDKVWCGVCVCVCVCRGGGGGSGGLQHTVDHIKRLHEPKG